MENPSVEEGGGSITLVDAYCQYNRARPTDMISPEDLLKACENLKELSLPIEFHRYESGVQMISLINMKVKEDDVIKWIRDVEVNQSSKKMVGVSEVDAAAKFNFSVIIAKQQLLAMEKGSLLCRDETLQGGLRFYTNRMV
jgi:ESCRT-II complex subunit VPS36